MQYIAPGDLKNFGLIPEIVGRLPVLTYLDPLDKDALQRILTEPKNALAKQYSKLIEMEGAQLDLREEALKAIAKKAMERKTGARGLRSILEQSLLDTMYELPSIEDVETVVVDESVINGLSEPLLIYANADKKASGE